MGDTVSADHGTGSCWHAPASGNWGTFTDNSRNCLDWDPNYLAGVGYVIMAKCNGAVSEQWFALSLNGGAVDFLNKYALNHNESGEYLAPWRPIYSSFDPNTHLSPYPDGTLSRWFKG
jgi:hypothetical protein